MSSRVSDSWLKVAASTRAQDKSYSAPVIINSFSSETQLDTSEVEKTPFSSPQLPISAFWGLSAKYTQPFSQPHVPIKSFACRYPEGLIRTQIRLQIRASGSLQPLVSLPVHWGWSARRRSISGTAPLSPMATPGLVVTQSRELNQREKRPFVLR